MNYRSNIRATLTNSMKILYSGTNFIIYCYRTIEKHVIMQIRISKKLIIKRLSFEKFINTRSNETVKIEIELNRR